MFLPQVTSRAREQLKRELSAKPEKTFARDVLNRLKNENPGYADLIEFLSRTFNEEFGNKGEHFVRTVGAMCFRALELGALNATNAEDDPSAHDVFLRVSAGQRQHAADETKRLIDRLSSKPRW